MLHLEYSTNARMAEFVMILSTVIGALLGFAIHVAHPLSATDREFHTS
jgi:hypothetical protein